MTFLSIKQGDSSVHLEDDPNEVFQHLDAGKGIDYYYINLDGASPVLEAVTIKTGTRTDAPDREVAEIEAGGSVVGSTEVVK